MTIAPIVHSVTVSAPPERAFALFTGRMGGWWKPGMTIGAQPHVEIVVEPRAGGRWFERDADGNETDWGSVLAWEPPGRALLGWQLNGNFAFDPELVTEVEITFIPVGTGTRVTLTHSRLERYGDAADRVAAQLSGGWPTLVQMFADFSEEQAS
ncbi:MAG: ATPase [Sphingomonas bacterium]|uniref:SRPBCC family protein n=1 Tax=Sphingomonas bacterium TaxID=1895847 RepID=UPI00261ED112|nr:SRPBCC family protein [Sphingomonas bacterium]MDB5712304.1 ATPase [Sphingomonas bacterium]